MITITPVLNLLIPASRPFGKQFLSAFPILALIAMAAANENLGASGIDQSLCNGRSTIASLSTYTIRSYCVMFHNANLRNVYFNPSREGTRVPLTRSPRILLRQCLFRTGTLTCLKTSGACRSVISSSSGPSAAGVQFVALSIRTTMGRCASCCRIECNSTWKPEK